MRNLQLLILLAIAASCAGCRWNGGHHQQPFGSYPQQGIIQPGYEQTFPPQSMPVGQPFGQPLGQIGQNAGQLLGNVAKGFLNSAVGGAGFTAGRDLWNEIVR